MTVLFDDAPLLPASLQTLLEKAQRLDKWALAQLISVFEGDTDAARVSRHQITAYLVAHKDQFSKNSYIVGVTGTPGAGKSTLVGELCLRLLAHTELTLAVLAVDPTSPESGGAILGDRTRVNFPYHENRLFFRSQSSALALGGISDKTFQAVRLLRYFFDFIFIETVGIGQSEIEVQELSHHTCLVLQPLTGDQIQFMKAGIMEIPDTFVINKCDEEALAQQSFHLLKASLRLAKLTPSVRTPLSPIFLTSAVHKKGIAELSEFIQHLPQTHPPQKSPQAIETFYCKKRIREDYGRWGVQLYEEFCRREAFVGKTYEQQEAAWHELIQQRLRLP